MPNTQNTTWSLNLGLIFRVAVAWLWIGCFQGTALGVWLDNPKQNLLLTGPVYLTQTEKSDPIQKKLAQALDAVARTPELLKLPDERRPDTITRLRPTMDSKFAGLWDIVYRFRSEESRIGHQLLQGPRLERAELTVRLLAVEDGLAYLEGYRFIPKPNAWARWYRLVIPLSQQPQADFEKALAELIDVRWPRAYLDRPSSFDLKGKRPDLSIFAGKNLDGISLRNADLSNMDLEGYSLSFSDLGGANLQGAIFKGTRFTMTNLTKIKPPKMSPGPWQDRFVWIGGGCALPGQHKWQPGFDDNQALVCVDSFFFGTTEVSQGDWAGIMGSPPLKGWGPDRPVVHVDWDRANDFLKAFEAETGRKVALPTREQWSYACLGRGVVNLGEMRLEEVFYNPEWEDRTNQIQKPRPTRQGEANSEGLLNMRGNVWEWLAVDQKGRTPVEEPLMIGGSWYSPEGVARCDSVSYAPKSTAFSDLGFRLVFLEDRPLEPPKPARPAPPNAGPLMDTTTDAAPVEGDSTDGTPVLDASTDAPPAQDASGDASADTAEAPEAP